jgi:hypothetical protein
LEVTRRLFCHVLLRAIDHFEPSTGCIHARLLYLLPDAAPASRNEK